MTERVNLTTLYPQGWAETSDQWTDRLLSLAARHGTYRQCSIGWHGECSQRHLGADADCRCDCHDPAPSPGTKRVEISWYATEAFTATVEVDEDFDLEGEDANAYLDEIICDMDERELSAAFQACTDREITSKKEASSPASGTETAD